MPARCRTQQWAGETFRHRWDTGIGPDQTWRPDVVPLLNRIGSGSQTWVAVAVTRPALSALALLAFALFAGDYLPGLLAELAPPLDNGVGLMLVPAVAASVVLPPALWWHAQHADTARAGRNGRDHGSRALPRPGRPRVRPRRHRASHGGTRRSGRRGSRAHPDPRRPGHQSSRLLRSAAACCRAAVTHSKRGGDERMSMARKGLRKLGEAVTKVKDAIDRATSGPGSGRQAATNDPRPVPGRPRARAMTPARGRPGQRAPAVRRGGWPGRRAHHHQETTRGQRRRRGSRCSCAYPAWIPMLGAYWRD